MDSQKVILELFSAEMLSLMHRYTPPETVHDREKVISGRLLEETVELHLDSGGTPESAMSCVMDAIANEAFKKRKTSTNNQAAYPSNFESSYNEKGVEEELGDTLFVWIVNMLTNNVSFEDVLYVIRSKLNKLENARVAGKLLITDEGKFYIQKD